MAKIIVWAVIAIFLICEFVEAKRDMKEKKGSDDGREETVEPHNCV